LAGKGFLAFIRRAICLKADFNVKREVRESFGEYVERGERATGGTLRYTVTNDEKA
jgi:hypothetical protein